MGVRRGRPRAPTSKHKLAGTFRADRHAKKKEPEAAGEPYMIGALDGHALDLWQRVVPPLAAAKIARAIDSAQLFAMCQWWAEFRGFQENTNIDGYKRACMMATAYKQFSAIASRFGLTPADREALSAIPEPGGDTPFANLMRNLMR